MRTGGEIAGFFFLVLQYFLRFTERGLALFMYIYWLGTVHAPVLLDALSAALFLPFSPVRFWANFVSKDWAVREVLHVKPGLSPEHTWWIFLLAHWFLSGQVMSSFDFKKCCWSYSHAIFIFFNGNGVSDSKQQHEADHSSQFLARPSHGRRRSELEHYLCAGGNRIRALICSPDDKRDLAWHVEERWDYGWGFFPFLIKVTFWYHKAFCNSLTPSVPAGPTSHTTLVTCSISLTQVSIGLGEFRSGFSPGALQASIIFHIKLSLVLCVVREFEQVFSWVYKFLGSLNGSIFAWV